MTNINGSMNLIYAFIHKGIKRLVALYTSKARNPANLFKATKLASDELFFAGNAFAGSHDTLFVVENQNRDERLLKAVLLP